MATFKTLTNTLKATKNPYNVLSLRLSQRRRPIIFRNGSKFRLTWQQFVILRDCYAAMQKYTVEQVSEDFFKIRNDKSEVSCASRMIPTICDLMQTYRIERVADDVFKIKNDKIELVGSFDMLNCVREQESGEYDCDCRDKIVLDVGGFQGESAVLLSRLGAKKVIIYEPVTAHHRYIEENVSLNHVNAEIHEKGIGEKDGPITIKCAETNAGFGLLSEGQQEVKIKIRNIAKVIEESGADVAKIDCEGAEECLSRVPSQTLQKIGLYMIEVHSPEVRRALFEKFKASGFTLMKETKKTPTVSVVCFKRQPRVS
jgi:FkbM family methyltransferase